MPQGPKNVSSATGSSIVAQTIDWRQRCGTLRWEQRGHEADAQRDARDRKHLDV